MTNRCSCCDGPATVLLRCTRFRRDDLIMQCDECLDSVCEACADVDPQTGITTCSLCLQTAAIRTIQP